MLLIAGQTDRPIGLTFFVAGSAIEKNSKINNIVKTAQLLGLKFIGLF